LRLKDVFEVEKNAELKTEYDKVYAALKEKYGKGQYKSFDKRELFENYSDKSSYARRTHTGRVKDGVELTELELSMICDDGYGHFGGSSTICSNRTFEVVIYTD
jgi:hypothetical protein